MPKQQSKLESRLMIRTSDDLLDLLATRAKKAEITPSEYARRVLERGLKLDTNLLKMVRVLATGVQIQFWQTQELVEELRKTGAVQTSDKLLSSLTENSGLMRDAMNQLDRILLESLPDDTDKELRALINRRKKEYTVSVEEQAR